MGAKEAYVHVCNILVAKRIEEKVGDGDGDIKNGMRLLTSSDDTLVPAIFQIYLE